MCMHVCVCVCMCVCVCVCVCIMMFSQLFMKIYKKNTSTYYLRGHPFDFFKIVYVHKRMCVCIHEFIL